MSFRVPQMPTLANIWHAPNEPPDPPDDQYFCQLRAPGEQQAGLFIITPGNLSATWQALFVKETDVRDINGGLRGDFIEIPLGTGRMYEVVYVDDVAKGFPNEYRMAAVRKITPWPIPIP